MVGGHQGDQWQDYRNKLERALANDAPTLEMTIQSSATLIKGEKIQVNALGLVSHESKRTNPETRINAPRVENNDVERYTLGAPADGAEQDLRDGFVFIGCKKSIK